MYTLVCIHESFCSCTSSYYRWLWPYVMASNRAIGSSFEVVRPSGRVRLCLLVLVNVITPVTVNIVLVKLIQLTSAGSVFSSSA